MIIDWTLISEYVDEVGTPGYTVLRYEGPEVEYTGPADAWGSVVAYFEGPGNLGLEIRVGTEVDPATRNTNESAIAGPTGPGTYRLYASADTFDAAAAPEGFTADVTAYLATYDVVLTPEVALVGGAVPQGSAIVPAGYSYWDGGFGTPALAQYEADGVTPNVGATILMGHTGTLMTDGQGNGDVERTITRDGYEVVLGPDTSAAAINPALAALDPLDLPDGYVAAPVYDGPIY